MHYIFILLLAFKGASTVPFNRKRKYILNFCLYINKIFISNRMYDSLSSVSPWILFNILT